MRLNSPSVPIARFANPTSRTIASAPGPFKSKIDSAVNCGLNVWVTPAMNSLTPTLKNTNHLPTSAVSVAEPG